MRTTGSWIVRRGNSYLFSIGGALGWSRNSVDAVVLIGERDKLREHVAALADWIDTLNPLLPNPSTPAAFAAQRAREAASSGREGK